MPSGVSVVRVGVQVIVRREGKILLGCRHGDVFQSGSWGLPGGHLEIGETLIECASRELREETDLVLLEGKVYCVTDPLQSTNYHMQVGVEAIRYAGEPRIMEPDRCSKLGFFSPEHLPTPLFTSSVDVLACFRADRFHLGIELNEGTRS
jgi:8-oxo-dGTP diphosphatase